MPEAAPRVSGCGCPVGRRLLSSAWGEGGRARGVRSGFSRGPQQSLDTGRGGQQPVTVPEQPRLGAGESGPVGASLGGLGTGRALRRLAPWGHCSCATGDTHARRLEEAPGGSGRRKRLSPWAERCPHHPSLSLPSPLSSLSPRSPQTPKVWALGQRGGPAPAHAPAPLRGRPGEAHGRRARGGLPQASVSTTVLPEVQKVPPAPFVPPPGSRGPSAGVYTGRSGPSLRLLGGSLLGSRAQTGHPPSHPP